MSQENIYENVPVEPQVVSPLTMPAPQVEAKQGFAIASFVLGIFAFITTLFFINYLFGILALVFGTIYLVKKADVKPKGKAITGIILAVISLIISTCIWVSAYMYFVKTDVYTIMEDAAGIMGEEIDGRETLNQMLLDASGNRISIDTLEEFVGGEISVERLLKFIGDVKEVELTEFIDYLSNIDPGKLESIIAEFDGEITYEKLEEMFGKEFKLRDIINFVRNYQ